MKTFVNLLIALFMLMVTGLVLTSKGPVQAGVQEQHIVIVACSWNNAPWYKKHLDSIFMQKYENYKVIYVDDCSTDGTPALVERYIEDQGVQDKITLIKNVQRQKLMANLYNAVHSVDDSDIVIVLDADDWFAHDKVLQRVNRAYQDQDVWLTYGQFQEYPSGRLGICKQLPQSVVNAASYRKYTWVTSHLRTFRAGLFKSIREEDLKYQGAFFSEVSDMAIMFPMLEMAHGRTKFIPDVLHIYNVRNPLAVFKINRGTSDTLRRYIKSLPKYQPLDEAPWQMPTSAVVATA